MNNILYLFIILLMSSCIVTDDIKPEDLNNVDSGLQLHITFDNKTANDISGNNLNGVINSTNSVFISNTPNGYGYAYNIISANDLLRIPFNPFNGIKEYSICLWLRDPSQGLIINAYGNNTDNQTANYPMIRISNNILYAGFKSYSTDTYFNYNPAITLQDGDWHHVVITVRNQEQKLYIDGQLVATQQASVGFSESSEVHLGGKLGDFTGSIMKIDNVRIYNRVISQKEVELIIEQEL